VPRLSAEGVGENLIGFPPRTPFPFKESLTPEQVRGSRAFYTKENHRISPYKLPFSYSVSSASSKSPLRILSRRKGDSDLMTVVRDFLRYDFFLRLMCVE